MLRLLRVYILFWTYYSFRTRWVLEDFGDESARDIDTRTTIPHGRTLTLTFPYFAGRRVQLNTGGGKGIGA